MSELNQSPDLKQSNEINEIASALNKAQSQIEDALKDSNNPFFKSKYATLQSVRNSIKKPFSDAGLSYIQSCGPIDQHGFVHVITKLMHTSGQWIEISSCAKPKSLDPQSVGSTITYLRRYSLSSVSGIATEEDDDGNAGSHDNKKKTNYITRDFDELKQELKSGENPWDTFVVRIGKESERGKTLGQLGLTINNSNLMYWTQIASKEKLGGPAADFVETCKKWVEFELSKNKNKNDS